MGRTVAKILLSCFVAVSGPLAAGSSPVGLWVSQDETNAPRSIVEIYEAENTLSGKIVKQLHPRAGKKLEENCSSCGGDLKNKPKVGMVILSGFTKSNDKWIKGKILDTDSGSSYNCKLSLKPDGDTLIVEVNAFLVFGATLEWKRSKAAL